jgi:hypothetical protein
MRKIFLTLSLFCLAVIPAVAQEPNFGPEAKPQVEPLTLNDPVKENPAWEYDYEYLKWRLSFDVGWTYRIATFSDTGDPQEMEYQNGLRSGFVYGFDIHNYFVRDWALGLRFSGHHYAHRDLVVNTYYFAPSVVYRHFTKSGKGAWVFGASVGYLDYNEKRSYFDYYGQHKVKYSNGAVGSTLDIGYDIRLGASDTFLGFRVTMFAGTVTETVEGQLTIIDLNALDLGVGLRF